MKGDEAVMRCPICGKKVINVISNINHPADILGCDECLPPELDSEDLIDIFDTDPEWEAYREDEEEEEDDEEKIWGWGKYNIEEDLAVEEYYAARR